MKCCSARTENRMTNALRRMLLRLYYSSTAIYQNPFCCGGKVQIPPFKVQILVLGLAGVGKTTFCLKACNSTDSAISIFTANKNSSKSQETILIFRQIQKRRCFSLSPSTVIKYVEIGGKERLSESKVNSVYAQSHGVILLLDLSLYPCQASSLDILSSTLGHPLLNRKPILVIGSKLDHCPLPMDTSEFIRTFDLRTIATEHQTQMLAMTTGRLTKNSEIAQNIKWFLKQILQRKEEMNERIKEDLRKLAKIQIRDGDEEGLLFDKLFEAAIVTAREAKNQESSSPEDAESSSSEELPEIAEPSSPSGGGDVFSFVRKELEATAVGETETAPALENQSESSGVESEGEWEPMGEEVKDLSILMKPSWIEEMDEESNPSQDEAPLYEKSKSLNDLCDDDPGQIPLRRVPGEANLMLVNQDEGFWAGRQKMTSDSTKCEVTEVIEFGPDIYSSPVGGGDPGHLMSTSVDEFENSLRGKET